MKLWLERARQAACRPSIGKAACMAESLHLTAHALRTRIHACRLVPGRGRLESAHLGEEPKLAEHARGHDVHEGDIGFEHDGRHQRVRHIPLADYQRAARRPAAPSPHHERSQPLSVCNSIGSQRISLPQPVTGAPIQHSQQRKSMPNNRHSVSTLPGLQDSEAFILDCKTPCALKSAACRYLHPSCD